MIDDTELIRRLDEALRARADLVSGPTERFDPEQPSVTTFVLSPAPARRRGRTIVLAAAATIALAAAVTVATRPGRDGPTNVTVPAAAGSLAPVVPDGVPVPTAAPPEGTALWSVAWGRDQSANGGPAVTEIDWTQLFGVEGDPEARILIEYGFESDERAAALDWSNPVATVRGQDAVVTEYGDGAFDHDQLVWREGDRVRLAPFRGMAATEAAAAIDTLQDRPGEAPGFDVPAGGPLTLLGESNADPSATQAQLVYATGVPGVEVNGPTAFVEAAPATGEITRPYLHTWFAGERADDGMVTSSIPQSGIVSAIWPDGRSVGVDGGASDMPLATLEQLATSAEPTSADQLTHLWSEANGRLAALPVVAAADVGPAFVELRGNDGTPQVLCLRRAEETTCAAPGTSLSGANPIIDGDANVVGLTVGREWYVAVAAPDGTDVRFDPADLPLVEASADGWTMWLSQPPDGVDQVNVDHGDVGHTVYRP